jgi:L-alanine-DL-glutamate epimerase-like enolase superfamily enzyme
MKEPAMGSTRRGWVRGVLGAGFAAGASRAGQDGARIDVEQEMVRLERVAAEPVLRIEGLRGLEHPVEIERVELLRNGREYLVRVRAKGGGEGLAVPNSMHLLHCYPIFVNRVAPFFAGKDARGLEGHLWELYRHQDNYKYQGLALWVCVAGVEFAILDLLGKLAGVSVGTLLGGTKRREVAVYRASGTRGNTPEAEVEDLKRMAAESGAQALKFRLGGRMSKNADSLPGRTEKLIPLVREAFGPGMTLYADANSSYDAREAIRIGRIMEEHDYAFYEEPCRFDHLEETKAVADALEIPVAGGEQEFSEYGFRWAIAHRGLDIVQPDLHYHGGLIRSLRVARMAHAAGLLCTPHMSGSGLGYLDAALFSSIIPNPMPFTEYKGDAEVPVTSRTASLRCENGMIRLPDGPGFGIDIDTGWVRECREVRGV